MNDLKKANLLNIQLKEVLKTYFEKINSIDNEIADLQLLNLQLRNMSNLNKENSDIIMQIVNDYIIELQGLLKRNLKNGAIGILNVSFIMAISVFLSKNLKLNFYQIKIILPIICCGIMIKNPADKMLDSFEEYNSNKSEIKEIENLDEERLYTKSLTIIENKVEALTNEKIDLYHIIAKIEYKIEEINEIITDINQDNKLSKSNEERIYHLQNIADFIETKNYEENYIKTKKKSKSSLYMGKSKLF